MNQIMQFDNIVHTIVDDLKEQLRKGAKVNVRQSVSLFRDSLEID